MCMSVCSNRYVSALSSQMQPNAKECAAVCPCYLGRGMDPDGRVEQNVVTQLLEEQDAILQVA